jgi:hypothetical protein
MTWAPDACTLPTAQRPLRVAEFQNLFADALRGWQRLAPTHLRLVLDGAATVEALTRDLAARENECCAFFDFDVGAVDGSLRFDIRVPPNQVAVLDGLVTLAQGGAAA